MKRLLVACCLVLAACSSLINSVTVDRDTGTRHWKLDNLWLAGDIQVKDIKEEAKDNMLFVNVMIHNGWRTPISGKVKLLFFDKNGVQFDDQWGWQPIQLESNQDEWFKFIAPRASDQVERIKIMTRGIGGYQKSG
jgi:uncharacterized protein YcfL